MEPEFDGYALKPPEGDWDYVVDDTQVRYSKRWPWPFEKDGRLRFEAERTHPVPASVRISPDVAYYSWRNEYVLLFPSDDGVTAAGSCRLWLRPQGMGAMVVRAFFTIHVPTDGTRDFRCAFTSDPPAEVAGQGEAKLRRIEAFLRSEAKDRDEGRVEPVTAADLAGLEEEKS
jgi:hypothetical protein